MAFQVASSPHFRNAFLADAKLIKDGVDVLEVLTRPLYANVPDTEKIDAGWMQFREKLEGSSVAPWDVWINWVQDRIDGRPLDLEQSRKWLSVSLEDLPRASKCNRNFAMA